ncbi:MAG: DUF2845 domain-containing protein [Deltaproteobacteria bacterium]|nr:DUF2845 domain-containing protein [Deltaproteobacteria bacterium]
MRPQHAALALASLLCLPLPAAADGSLRCGSALVSVGDSKLDLLGKCGRPALEEQQPRETGASYRDRESGAGWRQRSYGVVDRWTYDFGTGSFIQIVTMELGKIVRIEQGGRGYGLPGSAAPPIPRARCEPSALREGDGTFDALARCGEPAVREARTEERTFVQALGDGRHEGFTRSVLIEVWSYDFGRRTLVRHVVFEDGKIVRVETGSYGYAD